MNAMKKTTQENRISGVSHPKRDRAYVSVGFQKDEALDVKDAAKESGRSVSGFLRYAALRLVSEMKEKV